MLTESKCAHSNRWLETKLVLKAWAKHRGVARPNGLHAHEPRPIGLRATTQDNRPTIPRDPEGTIAPTFGRAGLHFSPGVLAGLVRKTRPAVRESIDARCPAITAGAIKRARGIFDNVNTSWPVNC